MKIEVKYKFIWGKELFYPVSEDAIFIAKIIGRPSLSKRHLKICKERGWKVSIISESIDLDDYLKDQK